MKTLRIPQELNHLKTVTISNEEHNEDNARLLKWRKLVTVESNIQKRDVILRSGIVVLKQTS